MLVFGEQNPRFRPGGFYLWACSPMPVVISPNNVPDASLTGAQLPS